LKNEVPIPPSAKFLLIHLAHKLFTSRKLHRQNQAFREEHFPKKQVNLIKV
jgi:hypothetical protein